VSGDPTIMKFRLFILLLAPILTIPIFIPILDDAFTADWYNNSWEQRKKITTSLNTVISSDLTDFPALISFTDSDLTQTTESDGTDIVFTASDGTTELAYEIERFDQSTGEVIAWVKIPTVSASDNTDIYLYYKGTATSSSSSVWDSSYKLVWHLNQTSTGTVREFSDVSDTGNDGTGGGTGDMTQDEDRRPTRVEAKIGYGQSFDGPTQSGGSEGSGDFIWSQDVSNWPGNNGSTSDNDTTVEFWAKIDDDHANENDMDFFGYRAGGKDNEFTLFKVASLNLVVRGQVPALFDSDVDATTSDWTHLMIVYDPGGTSKIYQDGELAEQVDGTSGNKGQRHNGEFVLGGEIDDGPCCKVNNELQGDLDEFRVSNTVRSADWAAASYANQNDPSSFLTIGPEGPLTVTITSSSGSSGDTVNSSTLSYTATFSSTVSDFTIGDITVTGTADDSSPAASNFAGSGTTYTFDVEVSTSGTVIVDIAADAATNTSENGNSASNTYTLTVDLPPSVTITSSSGSSGDTVNSSTLSYTATFNESVSNFVVGDITVTGTANGSSPAASNFAGSGTTYTFDVKVSSSGTVIVDIVANVATDTGGNGNSASNTYTLTVELPPSGESSTCTRHVILGNCGTIAINNDEYRIINTWTNVPTTEVLVGQPVTVTLSTPNNPTHTKIHFASVHTEVFSIPANFDQTTHIDYSIMNNQVTYVSQSQLFQVAGATHRIVQDPDVKNLEMFEVVFTMIFAKPMDTSHVVVETENKFGIPETLYLMSALKVNENLPQALTLEEKSKFSIIDPESEMDPEPEIDPEPEQTKKEKSKRQRR